MKKKIELVYMDKIIPRPPKKRQIFVIVECFSVFLNGIQLCLIVFKWDTSGNWW